MVAALIAAPAEIEDPPAAAPVAIVIDSAWLAVFGTASTACTVKLHVCAVVGIPPIVPVAPVDDPRFKPAHRLPDAMLHVTGVVQLAVLTVCE
jgi:hypothetical protein